MSTTKKSSGTASSATGSASGCVKRAITTMSSTHVASVGTSLVSGSSASRLAQLGTVSTCDTGGSCVRGGARCGAVRTLSAQLRLRTRGGAGRTSTPQPSATPPAMQK